MLVFLEYIVVRLLLAIIPTSIWTIASIVILSILYVITGKKIEYKDYFDNYMIITNYILIFLCLVIFYNGNIELF